MVLQSLSFLTVDLGDAAGSKVNSYRHFSEITRELIDSQAGGVLAGGKRRHRALRPGHACLMDCFFMINNQVKFPIHHLVMFNVLTVQQFITGKLSYRILA